MRKLRKYYTGYLTSDYLMYPRPPYKGKGWNITFSKASPKETGIYAHRGKSVIPKEITINAPSLQTAQNTLYLLNCALWLSEGEPVIGELDTVIPGNQTEFRKIFPDFTSASTSRRFSHTSGFPRACMIAAKASYRKNYKYALAKIKLASTLHSVFLVDIDPSLATEHLGVSPYFTDHVRFAYSIIASYSAIEEIGLQMRPYESWSNDGKNWDPTAKQKLEDRLRKAGADLNEKVPWDLRGKPTRIEKAKRFPSQGKCTWARGPYVRDCELEVIDAIRVARFLRSQISSHKLDEKVSSLTSYDVENVRHLARRLLLERLGFWRYYLSGLSKKHPMRQVFG